MFHLDWIFLLIPKTVKAAVAEVVMLISVSQLFTGLFNLLVGVDSTWTSAIRIVLGFAVGVPATIVFFREQHMRTNYSELETLENYYKSQKYEKTQTKAEPWHMHDDSTPKKQQ